MSNKEKSKNLNKIETMNDFIMEIRLLSGLIATDFAVGNVGMEAYIYDANVLDNGEWRSATEDELDELNEDSDLVYKCAEGYSIDNIYDNE